MFGIGRCASLGGPVEKRSGRIGHRVQPVQWCQTDQVVRARALLLQFSVVVEDIAGFPCFIAIASITLFIVRNDHFPQIQVVMSQEPR
jgi:hypothetical protein